jgi:hypothetical protein
LFWNYDFSQDQAAPGGIVPYVQKLNLIRAYQNAIKNFCEDRNQSDRNDESTFRAFFNKETRQVVIFDRETKIFITGYKLAELQARQYEKTQNIGRLKIKEIL